MLKHIFSKVTAFTIMTLILICGSMTAVTTTAYANNDYKRQIFSETNNYRAANGKAPIYASSHLNGIAQRWADYLARSGEYKHNPNLKAEIWATPGWGGAGENLVVQREDGYDAMDAWKESSGHRNNLLGNYNRIGIGYASGGAYGSYYVQVFGYNTSDPSPNLYGAPLLPSKPTSPPPTTNPPVNPPVTQPEAPPANNNGGGGGGNSWTPPPAVEEPSGPSPEEIAAAERAAAEQKKRDEEAAAAKKKAEAEAAAKKKAEEKERKQLEEAQNKTLAALKMNDKARITHAAEAKKKADAEAAANLKKISIPKSLTFPERSEHFILGNIQNTPLMAKNAGMTGAAVLGLAGTGFLLNRKRRKSIFPDEQYMCPEPTILHTVTPISYMEFVNKPLKARIMSFPTYESLISLKIVSNEIKADERIKTRKTTLNPSQGAGTSEEGTVELNIVTPPTFTEFMQM